jgi:arylsulfatase A-like enzyme
MKTSNKLNRRTFNKGMAGGSLALCATGIKTVAEAPSDPIAVRKPNIVFVFADQWRAQATGYAGDPNVKTPCLDKLAAESLDFTQCVSGCPVCTPYRGSLLTGQDWLTHGLFMNDVYLSPDATSLAEACTAAGYDTAYIGKWHIDGHGRSSFIPKERRQGFDYWKVLECTHDYNNSPYYGDTPEMKIWQGYDAQAQTVDACEYIRAHGAEKPYLLVMSWGPPHNPFETAPAQFRALYDPATFVLRPNVPDEFADQARQDLHGYYSHISALDSYVGDILKTLEETGQAENTLFVFTSDHGDMLCSQGLQRKQKPWDESILVPFLMRYPEKLGRTGRKVSTLLNTPDIMPTLLGLANVPIPKSVEGTDFSKPLLAGETPAVSETILMCVSPFGEFLRNSGGREYRGIRTSDHTYVRDLDGPWLCYNNINDPYQMKNLCEDPGSQTVVKELDRRLKQLLDRRKDAFLAGEHYLAKWNYQVDDSGTVPYKN